MAFKIIRKMMNYHQLGEEIVAILDSANDLAALKASGKYVAGSVAIVADKGGAVYMLNASNEWKEQ